MNQHGFSLTEVLIATAISSLLLISASRFLPGLQRAVLLQSGQREVEEEVWQRLFALGKQLQRAGYCAGNCPGQGLVTARHSSSRHLCNQRLSGGAFRIGWSPQGFNAKRCRRGEHACGS